MSSSQKKFTTLGHDYQSNRVYQETGRPPTVERRDYIRLLSPILLYLRDDGLFLFRQSVEGVKKREKWRVFI